MTTWIEDLNKYIKQLTSEEKAELALALKKQLLLAEAERLSSFKPRKKIPVQEVIKEVRIIRKKRNASKSRP